MCYGSAKLERRNIIFFHLSLLLQKNLVVSAENVPEQFEGFWSSVV
jgi:hypothetical protein